MDSHRLLPLNPSEEAFMTAGKPVSKLGLAIFLAAVTQISCKTPRWHELMENVNRR